MEKIFVGTNVQEQRDFLKKFIEKMVIRNKKSTAFDFSTRN